jgi:adenylate cyclase
MRGKRSTKSDSKTHQSVVPERCLVTVVMVDIVGSSQLLVDGSELEFVALLRAYMDSAASVTKSTGGSLDKFMGDGFIAIFPTPSQAVDFAVAFQNQAQALTVRHRLSKELRTRIGIASGEAVLFENNVVGTVVNLAARLCTSSQGGDILLDAATVALLDTDKRARVSLLGSFELKGFGRYPIYSYVIDEED